MAQYKVTDTELSSIANAIRTKGGTSAPLVFPSGFVSAVINIPSGGGANLGSISISQNGTYTPTGGLDGFDNVVVNVEGGITPSGSISISQNGTYDVSSFANAVVSVPQEGGSDDKFLIAIGASVGSIYDTEASVVIPYAFFRRTSAITGIEMTNATSIGSSAFYNCSSLATASFPKCASIGASAFSGCNALSAISFPECTNIGDTAFYNCGSLATASFPKCTSIGANAFAGCNALSAISFPECTNIGTNAFYNCSSLATASFPKCTSIGSSAFYACSLSTVSFPKCTSIHQSAFFNCRYLASVYLLSESVTTLINSKTFYQTPISVSSHLGVFGSVYVPASLVDAYKSAQNWSVYSDRITAYIE